MHVLRRSKTKGFRLVLCLIISSVCLYLAVRGMNFEDALQQLKRSSPTPVLGAVLFLFLSFWIRAYRWRYLLVPIKKIPVLPLFGSTLIGFMGNYLLPFRAGEVMRAVSIGQTQHISKAVAFGSIVLERVFDGVVLSLTPFFFFAVIEFPPWLTQINVVLLVLYVAGLAGLVIAMHRGWTEAWIQWATALLPRRYARRIGSISMEFLNGMKGITRAGALLPIALLSVICWGFHALYFFLIFMALDLELSFAAALILQMVIGLGVILPAAPGYVGNFEYFTVLGLAMFGITQEAAFAYALLAHIFQFIPVTAVGLFFALRSGFHRPGAAHTWAGERFEVRRCKLTFTAENARTTKGNIVNGKQQKNIELRTSNVS